MTTTSGSTELNNLEAQFDAEIEHLNRQKTHNVIIGVVLVVLIFGYFLFMSTQVVKIIEPQEIAAMASQPMVSYLPTARAPLEETARREVPLLVNGLIDNLLEQTIPAARTRIKTEILSKADGAMNEAENMLFARVDDHLKTHGDKLRSLGADLSTDEGTKAFEDAIYASMEEVINDPSVQVDLLGYGTALIELDGTLFYLSQDEVALTPKEESARELIAVFREMMNRARKPATT